ncbi:MAG: lactonase family protein [Verrucomicrobiales bacterium]
MNRLLTLSAAAAVSAAAFSSSAAQAGPVRLYIGTYTQGTESKGIYRADFDPETGKLTDPALAAETPNPSFLAIAPGGQSLYAVNELGTFGGDPGGGITAFSVDAGTGALAELNAANTGGGAPCHVVVDKAGKHALVANYSGGSVAAFALKPGGALGARTAFIQHEGSSVDQRRQEAPHAHSINLDAANRFAFAADLGCDKVFAYRFDPESGALSAADPAFAPVAPGAGPRHFAFHPDGTRAYVINEMHQTVTAFAYDPEMGTLAETQTISTVRGEVPGNSTAEVQVHPSGKFVYGSNRYTTASPSSASAKAANRSGSKTNPAAAKSPATLPSTQPVTG